MKKLLVVFSAIAAGLAIWAPARAITPTTATIDCSAQGAQGPFNFSGQVGESFTLVNTGASPCTLSPMAGVVTPSGAGYGVGAFDPEILANGTATFTIVAAGTFTVTTGAGAGTTHAVAITLAGGASGPSGPATVVKGSFDPNGGECIFDGQKQTSKYNSFTVGFSYVPGVAECTRKGYVFTDWVVGSTSKSAGLPVLIQEPDMVKRHFVAQSGDYVAQWQKATASFDLAGGSCRIDGVVRAGWSDVLTDAQGKSLSTGDVVRLPAPEACSKDGARLVGWTSAITGDIVTASGATYVAQWVANNPTITITGYRTTVQGKPGICVSGSTTGIDAGKTVIPYFRFPGETQYSQGSARPEVRSDGTFEWCRKTGKKFYAYVTNADGSVTSNRVIIPAN